MSLLLVQQGQQASQWEMGVEIPQGKMVGREVVEPVLLGFIPRKKRRIIQILDLQ